MNKKGLDHIVVLVHKIYTISIPKPDNAEEWIGDSVEVGQEIRCCINHIDNKSKPPFICATLNSDYLQGCKLSDSIITYNMENVIESHNLNSTIKIEKTNNEISENNTISEKERKKHRKKHKKPCDIDTFKNIKYEDSNTDSTIEGLNENNIMIENSINEDVTVSDKEKKKQQKKHKKSREITLGSFSMNEIKAESSNNTENDTYKYIKHEINSNTDSIIKSQNLNSIVKIDTSTNQTLENDIISEKEKRKSQKKHRKSHASDLESTFEDKKEITLNSNTENNTHINIKCEDNVHNTNSAENIESHNLKYLNSNIKIDSMNGISDDAFSDKEKKKFRKKHKKSREIDTESISENKNEIKLSYNTDSNIHKNIKCEDNIHNTNSAIENHNLDRVIKIENLTSRISEEATFDREKTKHRKKRKKSGEIDTETETASDYLERFKKRKKTSTSPDLETHIKIKTEKFDSDLELKSPIKIKVEKA